MGRLKARLAVEVACALPERQEIVALQVAPGTTAAEAIAQSGILARFPQLEPAGVGIFGRPCAPGQVLRDGDRVEIYRPLALDPREQRRRRVRAA